ncbi:AAA family ATPase [Streptomyces olivoreticuli]|uniref:AAA family ATPase n=1 Tax=Streptomyces olivoreticuli TaxID=68246 RepID=UPI002659615B|nr:AAA family ATPase [Streptomyces olivoreticuli]WKK26982.1 AAA family ATPase [Streptomyces olivoreticuli]
MRIAALQGVRFRSLRNAGLEDCGQLNVLIGKNNSGKSNLLSAIRLFFDFFQKSGAVATISPGVSRSTDWHANDTSQPIEIRVTLELSDDERKNLTDAIGEETPQVRNALSSENLGNLVTVELNFLRAKMRVGYISRIAFEAGEGASETVIFAMSPESAKGIANNFSKARSYAHEITALERIMGRFDADDWRMISERGSSASFVRSVLGPDATGFIDARDVVRMIQQSSSYSDFNAKCRDRISSLEQQRQLAVAAEIDDPVTTFSGDSASVPDYVTEFVRKVASVNVHHLSEQRKPIGEVEASRILKLKTSRGQGSVLREIQSVVSSLLGVQIDAFSSDTPSPRSGTLSAELDVDDFLVQVNGSGIREALRLILDYEFERPEILLVEEPEVHLHPALETALMQYLKGISADSQVFLTTHSTNFLDIGSLENVYLIRKGNETAVQRLDVNAAEEALPEELGLRLSSLFMFDRLVFVEGPSDEQLLRTFADTLNVSFGQASLGFVTTGGARNFTHYATAATLSFLRKRNVRTVFVLDRDERNLQDLKDLQSRVDGVSEVQLLQRRELENYLLIPSTLSRFIRIKSGGASDPTPEEVSAAIDEVCEELFPTAVERRIMKRACRPVIPDRRLIMNRGERDFDDALRDELNAAREKIASLAAELEQIREECVKEVQTEWEVRKSEIVPGDELLDRLFQRYGLRFIKRQDALRIAQEMQGHEIPQEMMQLVQRLVS